MIKNKDTSAIVARCTPQGNGAIALIRISGTNAFSVATSISVLPGKKVINNLPTHTIHYGKIIDKQDAIVDQVMFFLMRGPHSFTGQDTVEITCHNNPFIIESIIQLAIEHGASHAQPGEFAQRAFINNKIDLVQAEAINELIHASNQMALRKSLAQLEGSFSHWLATIESSLLKCLAFSEASFEFIDEENMEFGNNIQQEIDNILEHITVLKKTFDQQQQIRQGIRIAIIGSVNAGKSSLFNTLLNQQRAIVTDIPGTTRDVIEAGFYENGTYITLVDTAGLRQTDNVIEKEGIARSLKEAQKADIILLTYDSSRTMTTKEDAIYMDLYKKFARKTIIVAHKADAPQKAQLLSNNDIACSSVTKKNIDSIQQAIKAKINQFFASIESPFLLNQRHFNLLLELEKNIKTIVNHLQETIEYEIVSFHIQQALESLTEFTGKTITEKGMDAVFREFCVGK